MSASKIRNLTEHLKTRWYGEKSKPSLFMSVCLYSVWTAINGGNISFRRAQWQKYEASERSSKGCKLSMVWDLSKSLVVLRLIQPPAFISPKQSESFFWASLSPAADSYLTQLMTMVGIESHQPLITFSVKQKQGGLSLLLGITRKIVIFPLQ